MDTSLSHLGVPPQQQQHAEPEAERAVFRMDTVVRLEPGVLLQNLTRANAAKVKRLRWSVEEEDWFPVGGDSRGDRRF